MPRRGCWQSTKALDANFEKIKKAFIDFRLKQHEKVLHKAA